MAVPVGEGCPPSIIRCFLSIYTEKSLALFPHNSQTDGFALLCPICSIRDMVKSFHISRCVLYLLCGHVNAVLSRRTPCFAHLVTSPLWRSTGKPSKATSKNKCNTAGTERGSFTWNATPVALPFCGVGSWPKITTFTSSGFTSSKASNNNGIRGSMAFLSRLPCLRSFCAKVPNAKEFNFIFLKKGCHAFGIHLFKYSSLSILVLLYWTPLHRADLTKHNRKKRRDKNE